MDSYSSFGVDETSINICEWFMFCCWWWVIVHSCSIAMISTSTLAFASIATVSPHIPLLWNMPLTIIVCSVREYCCRLFSCAGSQLVVVVGEFIGCVVVVWGWVFDVLVVSDDCRIAIKATLCTCFAIGWGPEFDEVICVVIVVVSDSLPWLECS